MPVSALTLNDGVLKSFSCALLPGLATYALLSHSLFPDAFAVEDTLAWLHATLTFEQKAKMLYIMEMGWLNLPEHDV